jgi:hypothetical protein
MTKRSMKAGRATKAAPTALVANDVGSQNLAKATGYHGSDAQSSPVRPVGGFPLLEHPKRDGIKVRAAICTYGGSTFLDLREWAERDGEPIPTKKGATVPLERLAELHSRLGEYLRPQAPDAPPTGS